MEPTQPPTMELPPRLPWLSLAITMIIPLFVAAGIAALIASNVEDGLFMFMNTFAFVGILSWMTFGHLLRPCFRGPSYWIMFFAYPIAQLSILLVIAAAASFLPISLE